MIRINAKELVNKQIERSNAYSKLTKTQKINGLLESMEFNIKMYNKHNKQNNDRYDKKSLNFSQWMLIKDIESIKKRDISDQEMLNEIIQAKPSFINQFLRNIK